MVSDISTGLLERVYYSKLARKIELERIIKAGKKAEIPMKGYNAAQDEYNELMGCFIVPYGGEIITLTLKNLGISQKRYVFYEDDRLIHFLNNGFRVQLNFTHYNSSLIAICERNRLEEFKKWKIQPIKPRDIRADPNEYRAAQIIDRLSYAVRNAYYFTLLPARKVNQLLDQTELKHQKDYFCVFERFDDVSLALEENDNLKF